MLGVIDITTEHAGDQLAAFVCAGVADKGLHFVRIRQQADQIEMKPTRKSRIIHRRWHRLLVLGEIRIQHAINGIRARSVRGGQCHHTRLERRLVVTLAEGETFLPHCTFRNPLAQHFDLSGGHASALGRHLCFLVGGGEDFDQQTLLGVLHVDHRAVLGAFDEVLACVHAQAAFLLVAQMTIGAVLFQDRHDLVSEVDRGKGRAGEQQSEKGVAEAHGKGMSGTTLDARLLLQAGRMEYASRSPGCATDEERWRSRRAILC